MRPRAAIIVAFLVGLVSGPVHALVLRPATFAELVSSARAIAHGVVVDVHSQLSGDRRRIETLVTLRTASYLKGDLGREVTVVVPGGTVGRYRTIVSGAPQFSPGEEVVLFLGARIPQRPFVLRLGEGVFRVVRDARTGSAVVARRPLAGHSDQWQPILRGATTAPMSLSAFSSLVRTTMEAAR